MSPTEALRSVVFTCLTEGNDHEANRAKAADITRDLIEGLWDKGFEVRPVAKPDVQYVYTELPRVGWRW